MYIYTKHSDSTIASASPATASTVQLQYRFLTTENGEIPLIKDVGRLFQAVAKLPESYIHVEHSYASLASRLPGEGVFRALQSAQDSSELVVDFSQMDFRSAWASLEICDCCGSPGRINFFDSAANRFLKIGAPAHVEPAAWAEVLSDIAVTTNIIDIGAPTISKVTPRPTIDGFFEKLDMAVWDFIKLIVDCSKLGHTLQYSLSTNGITVRKSFLVESLHEEKGALICRADGVGMMLNLKAVCGFARKNHEDRYALYVLGYHDQILLELEIPAVDWDSSIKLF